MSKRKFVIYCDEAYNAQPAYRYHHYYGGVLIEEGFISRLEKRLASVPCSCGFDRELKWQNIDALHKDIYVEFMESFFNELALGYFKVRVLFLDRYLKARHQHPKTSEYFKLYYQFITRAFGWKFAPLHSTEEITLRLFFDKLPDDSQHKTEFRRFLLEIPRTSRFTELKLIIPEDGISEIDSRNHRIAQAVDILIGALGFRMNDVHKVKQETGQRGKRTLAKEEVYRYIADRLKEFGVKNPGISTGRKSLQSLWTDPVRLWRLEPSEFEIDDTWTKK